MKLSLELQLNTILAFELKLQTLLDEEKYQLFQQQQDIFSTQVISLLTHNSSEELLTIVSKLKVLETRISALQLKSSLCHQKLKEEFLLQKRNKDKIKAYK